LTSQPYALPWPDVLPQVAISQTTTDIDGKFQMPNLREGEYVVYAYWKTSISVIEWFVPVRLDKQAELKIDLSNNNAGRIVNKETPR
jgi:hypothetical protein